MVQHEVRHDRIEGPVAERQHRQSPLHHAQRRVLPAGDGTHRRLGLTGCDVPSPTCEAGREAALLRTDIEEASTLRRAERRGESVGRAGAQGRVRDGIRLPDAVPRFHRALFRASGDSATIARTSTEAAMPSPAYWKFDSTMPASTDPAAADRLISESLRP